MSLLGEPLDIEMSTDVIELLSLCQSPTGGYGGGPGQIPHLASTYAAVSALLTIGTEAAFASIDRSAMHSFLVRMKLSDSDSFLAGGFKMSQVGEVDIRGVFAALAVAEMLDIKSTAVTFGVSKFLERCQTYEGGIGGEPGAEAHGGYTFCGVAAHVLLGGGSNLNLTKLTRWAVLRQGSPEGGFMGRTNKLVDGCYSFWQGGIFPLLAKLLPSLDASDLLAFAPPPTFPLAVPPQDQVYQDSSEPSPSQGAPDFKEYHNARIFGRMFLAREGFGPDISDSDDEWVEDNGKEEDGDKELEEVGKEDPGAKEDDGKKSEKYGSIPLFNSAALQAWLLLCCQVLNGGMRDKPGMSRDFYHTCYCLSGLSVAQHSSGDGKPDVLGPKRNLLERTNCLLNILDGKLEKAHAFYAGFKMEIEE
eukprot:CAMPEP_0196596958 /NCGR_PEP_ID=MMETSP1081-20130531/88757_1 /TAXON_ID=36882 /ORGANISM="Pyramimonas amylifera, Strain CCMP720" /LENGTH=417 /DNA_ID=CAMNT_0041922175 /DNA_START=128 /DNA_END=1378 /DNA_ORIENTATION=+